MPEGSQQVPNGSYCTAAVCTPPAPARSSVAHTRSPWHGSAWEARRPRRGSVILEQYIAVVKLMCVDIHIHLIYIETYEQKAVWSLLYEMVPFGFTTLRRTLKSQKWSIIQRTHHMCKLPGTLFA